MTPREKAQLLRFVTSSSRAPTLGFQALEPPFTIHKVLIHADGDKLPTASTCFNLLKLPTYSSAASLRTQLVRAIHANAGFEMS